MKLTKDRRTLLEKEVDQLTKSLGSISFDDDEYGERIEKIERLSAVNDKKSRERINPNTIISVAGSLIGIFAVLTSETIYNNVITSKALGFVLRSRV